MFARAHTLNEHVCEEEDVEQTSLSYLVFIIEDPQLTSMVTRRRVLNVAW